jgi:hypothetical protein
VLRSNVTQFAQAIRSLSEDKEGEMSDDSAGQTFTDYTSMDVPQLLTALGDDAMTWAVAFNQHAIKLGYSSMDEGWLVGWFANAIEHSSDVRYWRSQPSTRPIIDSFPTAEDTP